MFQIRKGEKPRSRTLRLAVLVIIILLTGTLAGGCGCMVGQVIDQVMVTFNGWNSWNAINQKAAEGYDVREARGRWSAALEAYNAGDYSKAGKLVDEANEALENVQKVGERIFYESSGGITVSGLLFEPTEGNGPWPLIIVNHAGFGTGADFSDVALTIRDRGYLVFAPDYRGSGESEGENELAKGEVDDVINGINYLKSRGLVEDDRIGLYGQSHGATVSMIVAGRYPGIKAVVAEAGFTDLFAMAEYAEGLEDQELRRLAEEALDFIGGLPEEVPEEYEVRSAINYVDTIQAPMLIIHGENDRFVPVEQAIRMHQALRDAGKTVELKIYPDEEHCVTDPENRAEVWDLKFAWFEKYV